MKKDIKMYIKLGLGSLLIVFLLLFIFKGAYTHMQKPLIDVKNTQNIVKLFAHDADSIKSFTKKAINDAQKQIDALLAISNDKRTWKNTAYALDRIAAASDLAIWGSVVYFLKEISTDKSVRDAASEACLAISSFFIDFQMNSAIYRAFKAYADGNARTESLDEVQKYFITETLKDFERAGLGLPEKKQVCIKELQKKLSALSLDFSQNIAADQSSITVNLQELTGLPQEFIDGLKKDNEKVVLGTDSPTYLGVMQHCTNAQVRRDLYGAFSNRAYPANEEVLNDIITTRNALAKELGYTSYADYELSNEMVHSVDRAESFLEDVLSRANKKALQEFALFNKKLSDSVILNADGTIKPWDIAFTIESYKKKQHDLDEQKISEYFPMEKTIQGLLSIYEQFLGLRLKQVDVDGLWHDEVRTLAVYDKDSDALLGYILLDLHPRPFKFSHACAGSIVPATTHDGKLTVQVSVVLANFPKGHEGKPSLLKPSDVRTFFHEFGHAIHYILGRQELASVAGANVKRDFVEMPSQMLEEWLWDKDMLKMISGHHKTGELLPNTLIDTMIAVKNLSEGYTIQRQISFGNLSLNCFKDGSHKDVHKLVKESHQKCCPHVAFDPNAHMYAAFGHLTGYGARYYGYLWSKVFALDLFSEIKKHGLLDPAIGKKYRELVIGKGGSRDPNELLEDFLGRKPNSDAFFRDLGI